MDTQAGPNVGKNPTQTANTQHMGEHTFLKTNEKWHNNIYTKSQNHKSGANIIMDVPKSIYFSDFLRENGQLIDLALSLTRG